LADRIVRARSARVAFIQFLLLLERRRIVARTDILIEDLMQAAWAPVRVARWPFELLDEL
jgi:hypothetical protein